VIRGCRNRFAMDTDTQCRHPKRTTLGSELVLGCQCSVVRWSSDLRNGRLRRERPFVIILPRRRGCQVVLEAHLLSLLADISSRVLTEKGSAHLVHRDE
jgi:hypothetical protein